MRIDGGLALAASFGVFLVSAGLVAYNTIETGAVSDEAKNYEAICVRIGEECDAQQRIRESISLQFATKEDLDAEVRAMNSYLHLCRAFRLHLFRISFSDQRATEDIFKGLEGCQKWSFEAGFPFEPMPEGP